jgi:predicted Zn-dependent protease
MKKGPILIALSCLLLAAGGTWWWQRAGDRQAIVLAALPPIPDLSMKAPVLRDRVTAAEARAQGRFAAQKGLADLSRLYHANGFQEEATRCYAGLEQLAPAEARWPHLHATIIAGYGEIEPAMQLWQRVILLAPDYVPARLRLGDCYLKTNRPDDAAAAYAEVLKLSPANSYALLGLARLDLDAGRLEKARERLETVVKQTNYSLGYDLIVSLYERTGQKERASAIRGAAKASGAYHDLPDPWLDGLLDDCFDPYRLALAAGIAAHFGESSDAVRLLERALALDPKNVSTHFQLGSVSVQRGDSKSAREQLEECTRLAPEFADGWAHLSALQAQMGEVSAAARTLLTGLSHCPDSPGLHLMRARNLRAGGQNGEAINEFQTSIRLRPNEPDAYVELGNTYIELGNDKEGIQKMLEAIEADPGHPIALSALAFQSIITGNETGARLWLTRVANQARVPHEQSARLLEAYRQAFGHDWIPDKPNE